MAKQMDDIKPKDPAKPSIPSIKLTDGSEYKLSDSILINCTYSNIDKIEKMFLTEEDSVFLYKLFSEIKTQSHILEIQALLYQAKKNFFLDEVVNFKASKIDSEILTQISESILECIKAVEVSDDPKDWESLQKCYELFKQQESVEKKFNGK
jgi:hypothetical protein